VKDSLPSVFLSAQRGRMGFVCLHQQGIRVQNKYADLSYSLEGLFIGKYWAQTYTTNHANLGANYGMRIVSLVIIITSVIILFELIPERSVWSILVKLEQEHMLAVPGSGTAKTLDKELCIGW